MTNREMLKRLREMYVEDGELNEEFDLWHMLDYLAIEGVPRASELSMALIAEGIGGQVKATFPKKK